MTGVGSPQPDIAHKLATQLLSHVVARLTAAGIRPARSYVVNSASVPADDCCDGIAWVRVGQVSVSDGSGAPLPEIRNLSIGIPGYAILLEAGLMRCFPELDEQGNAPSSSRYTDGALLAAADRNALRQAVICDFPDDLKANDCDGQIVGSWLPFDGGGCSGGYLVTTIGYTDTLEF